MPFSVERREHLQYMRTRVRACTGRTGVVSGVKTIAKDPYEDGGSNSSEPLVLALQHSND
jgi:hypothetical protein